MTLQCENCGNRVCPRRSPSHARSVAGHAGIVDQIIANDGGPTPLLDAYGKAGDLRRGRELFDEARDHGLGQASRSPTKVAVTPPLRMPFCGNDTSPNYCKRQSRLSSGAICINGPRFGTLRSHRGLT